MIYVIIIGFAVVVGFILWKRSTKPHKWHGVPIPKKFKYHLITHGGVSIRSVVPVPSFVQDWIDEGIQKQIDCVERVRPYWNAFRTLADYTVFLIEPMGYYSGSNPTMQGAPQLTVADGRNASAMNIGTGNDGYPTPTAVIPHQAGQDWRFEVLMRNAARFESEHIVLWGNDQRWYYEFTGANDIHPVFKDENGQ